MCCVICLRIKTFVNSPVCVVRSENAFSIKTRNNNLHVSVLKHSGQESVNVIQVCRLRLLLILCWNHA
jgi:hypothetical protein